ncbi:receptor-like protein 12 [Vigna radiata var. radiata]|uniref:Receptor-like protein 12 n=1 Tax=Vigna radiata var. radiata TaxID=3916 RepID=A0A1S3VXX8_VIGRR|nr:receptor-like protein 12 [Vigna radiata var. radiata]XP_022635089.1 receptor-like protein 12 [Vigna radiata var. radiata]XP_022635115.1 receptor-like protein 12 [Vigna radiata var. radiata]XP_022635134.1 receptor-like protein 12 [Vigna radiata var. radiata]
MIMKNLKVMMFMFVVSVVLQVAYGQHHIRCIPKEREALLLFKAAIVDRYAMLSSWTTPDCCRWKGIRCSKLTAHVLSLHLPGQYHEDFGPYMSGKIHKSLMELPQLMYLNLSSNSFRGSHIPRFIASLINLRYLDLSSCDFSGQIPTQISSLSHLKYLNLARNYYLEGSIPPQLGNLSRLQYLDLRGNSLEGYIPLQLGNLSNLHNLYLGGYNNALRIVSDKWLSNLISLTHLSFQSISNFNTSPTWLRMIAKLPKLRELSLIGCGLSDHFLLSLNPSNFNFSTSLSVLRLSENSFIQPMIFQWVSNTTSNLVELDLHGNLLKVSGSIPNRFGSAMISLKHLDLSYNDFKSENMKSIMNICTLRSLDMSGNNMTEDLSSILRTFSSGCLRYLLQDLNLANNQITGFISDLSLFSSLKSLDISSNRLSGKIREGTGLPSKLEHLSIGSNSLEGGIPKSFGNTCHLKSLDFAYNKLSEDLTIIFNHLSGCSRYSLRELYLRENKFNGTLPDFSMFPELKVLDLSSNQLKNGVPKSLRNATILQILNLSNNSLSEKFPTIIHHLSRYARDSLQHLYLSMNQISGTLPNTLAIFPSLKILNLGSNMLNGTIYEDFQFPIDLEELYLGSNSLKGVITDSHFHNMSEHWCYHITHWLWNLVKIGIPFFNCIILD